MTRLKVAGADVEVGGWSELMGPGARERRLRSLLSIAVACAVALVITALLLLVLGANPFDAFRGMWNGALGNKAALGQTLLATAPLIFCGLAAAIPLSARVFNVGGDGQLVAGAVGATAVAFWAPGVPAGLLVVLCMVGGVIGGAIWGSIAGALRTYAGANEVIVTLMLNFVAGLLAAYAITSSWADPIAPQTRTLPSGVSLPSLISGTAANIGVLIAVVAAAVATVFLFRTATGFGVRATGFNPPAARLAGFDTSRMGLLVLCIAGGFAGLGGAVEVVGNHQALVNGIASNYGFNGIAVALVARLNPFAVVPAAFLFAAVTVGANTLPATTQVSSSTSLIVLAVFVLALLALRVIRISYPEIK